MAFEKDRSRRVIFNDDAYQQTDQRHRKAWYHVTDEQSFLDARTTPTFDTHVDTYVWCVGNGCDPPWGSAWGLKYRGPVWPVLGSSARATDLIVEACHAKGMEVWGSLRMNDLHDHWVDLEEANDPLKAQHPEYLIGKDEDLGFPEERIERLMRTAFNYERSEVRKHRLDFIRRNAASHDFDGYELDFSRWIWNFPQGRERELAPLLTDFIRDVRSVLNNIGDRRGRPYTLVIHVMDSLETSLNLGQDVETWLDQGLVDVLVVGMGHMVFALDLDCWNTVGERYNVPIYPSLNARPFNRLNEGRLERDSAWHEYIRGAAAWWWSNKADGIYLFNLFTHEDAWGLDKELVYAPLVEVGDPAVLARKKKLFGIEPLVLAGMFSQASAPPPLPVPLDVHERRLPLRMGPDADDPAARFLIHAWTTGEAADTKIWMRLNHTLLEPRPRDGCYEAIVPVGLMDKGCNEFTIWCNCELENIQQPIILHEVLTSVEYGP
jgi:hypothetical protein